MAATMVTKLKINYDLKNDNKSKHGGILLVKEESKSAAYFFHNDTLLLKSEDLKTLDYMLRECTLFGYYFNKNMGQIQ